MSSGFFVESDSPQKGQKLLMCSFVPYVVQMYSQLFTTKETKGGIVGTDASYPQHDKAVFYQKSDKKLHKRTLTYVPLLCALLCLMWFKDLSQVQFILQ